MKKLLTTMMAVLVTMSFTAPVYADYTFVVPQKPGSGTSVWTAIVAKNLKNT